MRDWDGVTSPMARARETAAILFGRAVPVVRDLIEMGWGEWEGLTDGDLRARYGLAYDRQEMTGRDFAPPGGESPAAVQARLQPWLTRVGAGKRPTIAIAHKGIIRAVLGLATGWDFTGKPPVRMDWRSGQLFEVDAAGRPALARVNVPLVA
jgi:probable phosphoglycerate mutase